MTIFSQIFVSNKWGFTKWDREDYLAKRNNHELLPDGVSVQHFGTKGPLRQWKALYNKMSQ